MGDAAEKNLQSSIRKKKQWLDRINQRLGIAGKVVGALKKNFGGFAEAIGIDKIAEDMREAASDAERGGKALSRWGSFRSWYAQSAFKWTYKYSYRPNSYIRCNVIKALKK